MAEGNICFYCSYWYPGEKKGGAIFSKEETPDVYYYGFCRRYPPNQMSRLSADIEDMGPRSGTVKSIEGRIIPATAPADRRKKDELRQWPATSPTDWCGEFLKLDQVDEESLKSRRRGS